MTRWMTMVMVVGVAGTACKKEEPPPPKPPEILSADVICGDGGEDAEVVEEVRVEITDGDRDLVLDTLFATVNGVPMEEIADDDADDVFTWVPPSSWDPPMMCRGDFRIVAEVTDATNLTTKQTFTVEK